MWSIGSYLSRFTNLLRWERSTHILIFSVPFLGVTTIGAHQSVGSVTGAMMFCSCIRSSSALSLSRKAKGIVRSVLMQKGLASSIRAMWKYSPSIDLTLPSNTIGYSFRISPGGMQYSYGCDLGWVLWADRFGVMSGQDVKVLGNSPRRSTPDIYLRVDMEFFVELTIIEGDVDW